MTEEPRPGYKLVKKRDYSGGSIRDKIARAETLEELERIRQGVQALMERGMLKRRLLAKIEAAGAAKFKELQGRVVRQVPLRPGERRTPGGLIVLA